MANDLTAQAGGVSLVAATTLSEEAKEFARNSMALNTQRAYRTQWRLWQAHAEAAGLPAMPASPAAVANWISARANAGTRGGKRAASGDLGHAVATLRTAVAAVRAAHLAAGFAFDSRHPEITTVMQGISRVKAAMQAQASPLRAESIIEILAGLGASPIELRDAALLAIGYCFARRRSELAGLDFGTLGSGDGVLQLEAKALIITLVRSKANKGGEFETFVVPRMENPAAVAAIERWVAVAGIKPGEPVLRRVHKSGQIGADRIDAQSISLAIKRRISAHYQRQGVSREVAQAEAARFSGHSLRVGLAVTAAEAGADIASIQRALGHATPSMSTRYAKEATLAKTSPHLLAGVGLVIPHVKSG